ncbi:MAG: DHH family phosphoesterase [Aquificaceae bacterium]|nr:DHH family phosphoesterase [Aquificaceae bacterium]MDW8096913.1 DHH family phosphoesterase [Aquificaceae bacterium]
MRRVFIFGESMKGASGKEWVLLSEHIKPSEELVRKTGYLKAQLLANRDADESALENRLRNLLPPHRIPNLQEAVSLIADYVRKGKRIVLFGDYDVDGITGTATLYHLLKRAKARVIPVLPSRRMGYGLTKDLALKLSRYADLLVTVDNGTNAVEELAYLSIPVVVLDHHNPGETLPKALLVNPKLQEKGAEDFKSLSSSGLAFYLAALLRRELQLEVDVRHYLHFACLGTVADVMPMSSLNRIIVHNGMKLLNYILHGGLHAPGIKLLMENSGIRGEVSSIDITFSLAPRLNAPGRVANPYLSFRLLLEQDERRAKELIRKVEYFNSRRRRLSWEALREALKQVQSQEREKLFIVKLQEWAGGVAGIVAGRLASTFSKPAVVMCLGEEYATASVRGTEGTDVYSFLKTLSHLFVRWGGHASAAGFTIRKEHIDLFERLAQSSFFPEKTEGRLYADLPLPTSSVGTELYGLLKELEPYGEGFPEPVFLSEPLRVVPERSTREYFILKAGDYRLFLRDSTLFNHVRSPFVGRLLYKVDRRRPGTLLLVDLEK